MTVSNTVVIACVRSSANGNKTRTETDRTVDIRKYDKMGQLYMLLISVLSASTASHPGGSRVWINGLLYRTVILDGILCIDAFACYSEHTEFCNPV